MYQNSKVRLTRNRPLPRGRHGLDTVQLQATRKARLMKAMMEMVAQRGYATTTVPDVVSAARVSRNAFYEYFEDKEACFLAVCQEQMEGLYEACMSRVTPDDWFNRLRDGQRAYLKWWQERPEFSYAYFVEMPMVGARAVAQRQKIYEPFEENYRKFAIWMRKLDPSLPPMPARSPRMLCVATTEIVADEVRRGRVDKLPELENDLLYLVVKMLGADKAASRIVGIEPSPGT